MRITTITLFIGCMLFAACHTNVDQVKTSHDDNSGILEKKRCSFKMTDNLELENIDTTKFSTDGYFKIHGKTSNNMMQIFVYNTSIDPAEKVANQKAALNSPNVFTANTITGISHFGNYTGTGLVMDGFYNGGVVKGTIKVFANTTPKSGFLIIRQTLADDETVGDFDALEKSFVLK